MARAIPNAVRLQIIKMRSTGKSIQQISEAVLYSYDGVRKIIRMHRQGGFSKLKNNYDRCGRKSKYPSSFWKIVEKMLIENNKLGAPYIRSKLLSESKFSCIPHERTIQRWMKRQGYSKVRSCYPKQNKDYSNEVNHTWQIDGKENVKLQTNQKTCWLSIVDEASAAFLNGHVFTKKNI